MLPHYPQLPVLLLHQPRRPFFYNFLRNFLFPVKVPSADRENAVVCLQHIVAGAAHDGFRQPVSYETVHAHADLVYFFFIQVHSPSQ